MTAIFSPCGTRRMRLDRDLGREGPRVVMIGVNPSVAGAEVNDQTITKDIGFGARLGWGWLTKVNKFDAISTDIKGLRLIERPNGPENDAYIEQAMREADIVVGCWGPLSKLPKHLRKRWRTIAAMAEHFGVPIMCFGTAKDGQPLHTSRLAYDTPLIPWVRPR